MATTALAAMASPALTACDENATTAPGEPPRETVVEAQPPEEEYIPFDPFNGRYRYFTTWHADGSVVFYRDGETVRIDLPGDSFPWNAQDLWAEAFDLPRPEIANWSDFAICHDCELDLTEVVRFGDADGAGTIESAAPRVTWSAQLGYLVVGSTYLQVFDKEGRFVRRLGQEGDGPGRFRRVVDAHVVDGHLVALDGANRAWSIFNLAGDFVERRPYGYSPGPFVPVGGNRVVVVANDQSPGGAGFPLHLAHIDSGVPSRHFGSRGDAQGSGPYSNSVQGSVTSRPGTVWWGGAGSPRVQEWSVDDDLLRVIEGELPWFPEVTEVIDPTREPPSTLLRSLALDAREHLWMTTRTADPQWREVELERTPEGWRVPAERRADYMDTRLDIFDLEERRHLGSHVWDSPYARLINLGGEPAVTIVEHNDEMVPQVVVQRVHRDNASSRKE